MASKSKIPAYRIWLIAVRPFSLPASTMPVIFGTALAVVTAGARFRPVLFLLAFVAMVLLHCGANILSDVFDYSRGLDRVPTPASGAVVRGLITKTQALRAAFLFFAIGAVLGFLLSWLTTPKLLIIGTIGLIIGIFYSSAGPLALKYHALGDLAVFMDFGILGSLGAWMVQTGNFSWLPITWSVPMSLLVIAILHANNWRDIRSDMEGGITTIASLLGDKGSLIYYVLLIITPFAIIAVLMIFPILPDFPYLRMPYTFGIVLLALPLVVVLLRKAMNRKNPRSAMDFIALDGATAQLNLLFGALCTLALLLQSIMGNPGC
jgi:1,4-dihydroxy-2-naphthoate polyprenyltransferase